MAQTKRPRYQAYILRCWEETDAGVPIWRFSLQNPRNGERQGYTNLTELVIALQENLMETSFPHKEHH